MKYCRRLLAWFLKDNAVQPIQVVNAFTKYFIFILRYVVQ